MKIVTFYADAELPPVPRAKSAGFDWRWAIGELRRTARAALAVETLVVTDRRTALAEEPWLRVGDAREEGIMLWLLGAQAAAVEHAGEPILMVSPDTLIAGPVPMFGCWDVCLLTRGRPKPIVNSVIAVKPNPRTRLLWRRLAEEACRLPAASREWGADIDILVESLRIQPNEDGLRSIDDVRVRLLPMSPLFRSIDSGTPYRLPQPVWDFKGSRKRRMPEYATLLP